MYPRGRGGEIDGRRTTGLSGEATEREGEAWDGEIGERKPENRWGGRAGAGGGGDRGGPAEKRMGKAGSPPDQGLLGQNREVGEFAGEGEGGDGEG